MTAPTDTSGSTTDVLVAAPVDEHACPACPHPLAQHDRIGVRFCLATAAGTADRGCVCRVG